MVVGFMPDATAAAAAAAFWLLAALPIAGDASVAGLAAGGSAGTDGADGALIKNPITPLLSCIKS